MTTPHTAPAPLDRYADLREFSARASSIHGSADRALLLYALVRAHRPKTILEIGTGMGTCTMWMAMALSELGVGTIHSIDSAAKLSERHLGVLHPSERRPTRAAYIDALAQRFGVAAHVRFHAIKAPPLPALSEEYDFAIIDDRGGVDDLIEALAHVLPSMALSSDLFVGGAAASLQHGQICQRFVELMSTCRAPASLLKRAPAHLHERLWALIQLCEFQYIPLTERAAGPIGAMGWIRIQPSDVIPHPLARFRVDSQRVLESAEIGSSDVRLSEMMQASTAGSARAAAAPSSPQDARVLASVGGPEEPSARLGGSRAIAGVLRDALGAQNPSPGAAPSPVVVDNRTSQDFVGARIRGVTIDVERLRRQFEEQISRQPSTLYKDGEVHYDGWALLSRDGSTTDGIRRISAPDEKGRVRGRTRTSLCTGYAEEVLTMIEALGLSVYRARMMRLESGGVLMPFHDDAKVETWRLHIPFITHPGCWFDWRLEDGTYRRVHLPADGSVYGVRVDVQHRAVNEAVGASLPRVHMLMGLLSPPRRALLEDLALMPMDFDPLE